MKKCLCSTTDVEFSISEIVSFGLFKFCISDIHLFKYMNFKSMQILSCYTLRTFQLEVILAMKKSRKFFNSSPITDQDITIALSSYGILERGRIRVFSNFSKINVDGATHHIDVFSHKQICDPFLDFSKLPVFNSGTMVLSEGAKQRLSLVIETAKVVFHYAFIPTVLYLGFQKGADPGMPEISVSNLLW